METHPWSVRPPIPRVNDRRPNFPQRDTYRVVGALLQHIIEREPLAAARPGTNYVRD